MSPAATSLVVRASRWTCALPLEEVLETMRELPTSPCAGAPPWVIGASVIRGVAVPVVDLASFLGGHPSTNGGRFVTVRTGERTVALRVDSVVGVKSLGRVASGAPSKLLDAGDTSRVASLSTLDGDLLAVLELATLVPPDVASTIAEAGPA